MQHYVVAVGAQRPGDSPEWPQVAERLREMASAAPGDGVLTLEINRQLILAELTTTEALLGLLEGVARDPVALAACVWVGRPKQPTFRAHRWLPRAATAPERIDVGPGTALTPARRRAVAGLLQLHMVLVRRRSPAQWKVLDAVRMTATQADAAEYLSCSPQAVSRALQRAHAHSDDNVAAALQLLAFPSTPVEPNNRWGLIVA